MEKHGCTRAVESAFPFRSGSLEALRLFLPQWGSYSSVPVSTVAPSPIPHNDVKRTRMTILELKVDKLLQVDKKF